MKTIQNKWLIAIFLVVLAVMIHPIATSAASCLAIDMKDVNKLEWITYPDAKHIPFSENSDKFMDTRTDLWAINNANIKRLTVVPKDEQDYLSPVAYQDEGGNLITDYIYNRDNYYFSTYLVNGYAKVELRNANNATVVGLIDQYGNEVIHPMYKSMGDYNEGLIAAQNEDNRWGFIDLNNNWIIAPQYTGFLGEDYLWVEGFNHGIAIVTDPVTKNPLIIDKQNKRVCPDIFKWDMVPLPDGMGGTEIWYDGGLLIKVNGIGYGIMRIPSSSPEIRVIVDGKALSFDVPPQITNGRTLVPLRVIFEEMGATLEWDAATQTVTAKKGDTTVVLSIGNTSPTINGHAVPIDQAGIIVDGRTLAPLRFVAEAFGGTVVWDGENQTAAITK